MSQELFGAVARLIVENWRANQKFKPGETKVPLAVPPFGEEEILEVLDSLYSGYLTMGAKVRRFEEMFAKYEGCSDATMVNSGSSANLLALSVLNNPTTESRLIQGDEIITPALTWATTVDPITNIGAVPVLVDVFSDTFEIDPEKVEAAIGERTRAIMPVHLLGNPCDMDSLSKIAKEHDLFIVEDACEAHGAEYRGKKVGSFGDLSAFSFYISHHISTIEGGMVLTSSKEYAELSRSLRAFGWVRNLGAKDILARKHKAIDPRYMFVNTGFNIRPTEIQGAFGIHQLPKLDSFIKNRRDNVAYWDDRLKRHEEYLEHQTETKHGSHVYFGYALTVKEKAPFSRDEITRFLESKLIETRPVMAGNIAEQPMMNLITHRISGSLDNAGRIMRRSFFFGNHQNIGEREREYIADRIDEFVTDAL